MQSPSRKFFEELKEWIIPDLCTEGDWAEESNNIFYFEFQNILIFAIWVDGTKDPILLQTTIKSSLSESQSNHIASNVLRCTPFYWNASEEEDGVVRVEIKGSLLPDFPRWRIWEYLNLLKTHTFRINHLIYELEGGGSDLSDLNPSFYS